jgi:hypothetical protein
MTVMTRKHEALLEQLIGLAGDPAVVASALQDLNEELGRAPTLPEIVRRILAIKYDRVAHTQDAAFVG